MIHKAICPYCTEAREHKRWISYARGCDGCAARLVAATLKALHTRPSVKTAKRLARGVPLDKVKDWM